MHIFPGRRGFTVRPAFSVFSALRMNILFVGNAKIRGYVTHPTHFTKAITLTWFAAGVACVVVVLASPGSLWVRRVGLGPKFTPRRKGSGLGTSWCCQ